MISIAKKLFNIGMTVKGLHMLIAQTPSSRARKTAVDDTNFNIVVIRNNIFRPVNINRFMMIFFRMVRWGHYFKVLNSIIDFIAIYMVNTFRSGQLSAKMLFHQISVMQYAFTITIYPKITSFSNARDALLIHSPILRYIEASVSKKSAPMSRANSSFNRIENFFTTIYFTYFPFGHITIIAGRK